MVRYFWVMVFACAISLFSFADDISYGGMTIQCDQTCGDLDDPDRQEICAIFANMVDKIFTKNFFFFIDLDDDFGQQFVTPWETSDDEEPLCIYEVYDWKSTKGRWNPKKPSELIIITSYPTFLDAAAIFKEDLHFYYKTLPQMNRNFYQRFLLELETKYEEGDRFVEIQGGEAQYSWSIYNYDRHIKNMLASVKGYIKEIETDWVEENYQKSKTLMEKSIQQMDALFKNIFVWCLEHHQVEGIAFRESLENLITENFEEALQQLRFLIDLAEKKNLNSELVSKLYLLKGQVESEFCLHADAIIALTTAIQKNPSNKEAYFERATAYFELGEFDKAIENYLESNFLDKKTKLLWEEIPELSAGVALGIVQSASESAVEFIPSILSSVRGLGTGLWAFCTNPVGASYEFIDAATQCIQYLGSTTPLSALQDLVPELKELIQKHDELSPSRKGLLIGQIIGKYGTDIFLCKYSAQAIKHYRDLKKANQLMTLEALSSPQNAKQILEAAGKRWALREEVIKNGRLEIHWGRQGKHIEGHPNFEVGKSILIHPDPKQLVKTYGGTGIKESQVLPGTPGYKETVNFGEFIGYNVNEFTKEKTATTWGRIHYSKDGVHIVPTYPIE